MSSHQRTISELIRTAKALQAKASQASDKAEQFYISLGLTLAELKERKPKGTTWPAFVKKHFGYSQQRADELIQIAGGKTTLEKTRERKRVSMKRARAKSPPRGSGNSTKKYDACDEIDYPEQPGATAEEQAIFNVRLLASEAVDYCHRAAIQAKPIETISKECLAAVKQAANVWTAFFMAMKDQQESKATQRLRLV